jgi:hypothetical protein
MARHFGDTDKFKLSRDSFQQVVVDHHEEINQTDEQCLSSSSLSGLALLFRKRKSNFYYRHLLARKFEDARAMSSALHYACRVGKKPQKPN